MKILVIKYYTLLSKNILRYLDSNPVTPKKHLKHIHKLLASSHHWSCSIVLNDTTNVLQGLEVYIYCKYELFLYLYLCSIVIVKDLKKVEV